MLSCKIKLYKFGALIFFPPLGILCIHLHTMHALVKNVIDSNGFCPISIKLLREGEDNN